MSRGKRTDVARYEGISNLPGVNAAGWVPGVGMPNMGGGGAGFSGGMGGMAMPGIGGFSGEGMGAGNSSAPSQSLFQLIDDRMRGRWTYAIILGAILAAVAATVGYMSAEPMYVSGGTIEVQREVRFIYHKLDDLGISDYDRFVATQVQYIKSLNVLDEAVRNEKVKALKISRGMLKDGLEVERDRQSQLIYVQFEAEDPRVAEASVNAVLDAYYKIFGQNAKAEIDALLNELDSKVKELERKASRLEGDIRNITTRHNATDLLSVQKAKLEELNWLDVRIREGERELQKLTAAAANPPKGGAAVVQVPTRRALAMIDPTLPQLEAEAQRAQTQFNLTKSEFRPESAQYARDARREQIAVDALERAVLAATAAWRKLDPEELQALGGNEGMVENITADDIAAYKVRKTELELEQKTLVDDIASLASLTAEQARVQADILGMSGRMNSIALEMKPLNKVITISQYGSMPDQPDRDQRKTRLLMGLALGFAGSFGAFFLLGTIDRRAFGASQLGLGGNLPPCLGVLPDLGKSLSDPETSDVASHCVHQIRNQIEAVRDPHNGYVLCVSSPFQGDGKTSIVMALGWSYAAAGYNTLVIDCDMIGRSLTRQLGLTANEGLREALLSKELNGSVSRLPWANLSAVPVGVDARFGPENIRRMDLERLLEQIQQHGSYDMIIVDTGPLLGSLESTPVTAVADGVIFSVRRGRSRAKLEECVNRLKLVGTRCIGVILNCAQRSDCNRYVSEASLAAADENRAGRALLPAHAPGERNALVRAVQTTTRQRDDSASPSTPEHDE